MPRGNVKQKNINPIWLISSEELKTIFDKSDSIGDMLSYFNLEDNGGNYLILAKRLKKENIDWARFKLHISYNSKKYNRKKIYLTEEILVEKSKYSRCNLKYRILKENLIENKCDECGLTPEWNNKKLVMVLDHINGIRNDDRLCNLRFLCPNCNSQTDTFAGKNVKRNKNKKYCSLCNAEIYKTSIMCRFCASYSKRKVNRPSREELLKDISSMKSRDIAKKYCISQAMIYKWRRLYKISAIGVN